MYRPLIVCFAACTAISADAQSVIKTIFGGTPEGVPAISASLNTPSAVAVDAVGNVFVALKAAHSVIKIDLAGIATTVAGSGSLGNSGDEGPATASTLNSPSGLAVDSLGNLYIADPPSNRVRVVTTDGIIHAFAGTSNGGNSGDDTPARGAQLSAPTAIIFDLSGNALIADTGNAEIRMVTTDGIIHRFAGTGAVGYDGDTGTALNAQFSSPSGLAVDSLGNVYVSDTGNQRIRMIATDGTTSVITGKGQAAYYGDGRPAIQAYVNNPTGLAFDADGNLYIADIGNDRVRRITTDGKIASYAGTGNHGAEGDGGWATSANLNLLGIALDAKSNLLIADGTNYRVRIVTAADGIINTLAGTGLVSYNPRNVVSNANTIIFSDGNNNRIRSFDLTSGQINLVAGNGKADFSGDGAAATDAALNGPRGLFLDPSGSLYIADSGNNRIRLVTPAGTISTVAGNGATDGGGDLGPATQASLNGPVDVKMAADGNLYILEQSGQRLRRVGPDGTISTVAGTGVSGQPDTETGVATAEPLNFPSGIAVDAAGNVLIADSNNNRVRRVSSDGTISTVAGYGNSAYSGDGGPATAAALSNPAGVALDTGGNMLIADSGNNVVRRIDVNGNINTIAGMVVLAGSPPGGYNGDGSPATLYMLNQPVALTQGPDSSILIADMLNQRIRQLWPSANDPTCSFALSTTAILATSAGGSFPIAITTGSTCAWSVTNLPSWVTISAAATGTGNATVTLTVAPTTTARLANISIAGVGITINQAAPPACSYAISSTGQVFPAAGGTATVNVTAPAGCAWSVSGSPSGMQASVPNGSGSGSVVITVQPNTGIARSGTFNIAGLLYAVEQQAGSISGLTYIGSIPHLPGESGWSTILTFVNKDSVTATARMELIASDGTEMTLPVGLPQQTSLPGPLLASSLDQTMNSNASWVMNAGGTASQTLEGSAQLQATGNVDGFAIFHFTPNNQEAVVPMETRNASSYLLAFDNTNGVLTGVALENVSGSQAVIPVTIRNDTGATVSTGSLTLPGYGHTAFVLSTQYSQTANLRGTIEFDTPSGGRISALGIRYTAGTMTTIPVMANITQGTGIMSHLASGNGWRTTFVLANTGAGTANATLNFYGDNGIPLNLPLTFPQSSAATTTTATYTTPDLAAGASWWIQSEGDISTALLTGSAQLTTTGNVGAFVIFRYDPNGQEAIVPLENRAASAYLIAFDNTSGAATGIAIANASPVGFSLPFLIRDDAGAIIAQGTGTIPLAANGHTSFVLSTSYSQTANIRGTVEFDPPSATKIGVLGIRSPPALTFTTLPALAK